MTNLQLAYAHLAAILPAFVLGTYLLLNRKGTRRHRKIGRVYLGLIFLSASISLFMTAQVGPSFLGHFGYIHSLSVLTLITVPIAYRAARNGNVALHRDSMIGLYFGGIIIAGGFAFTPGRLAHEWLFGLV